MINCMSGQTWVEVIACTVVIRASSMPKASLIALTMGARPLVVHEAHDTNCMSEVYSCWLTPITMIGDLSLAGAEKTTFFTPAATWGAHDSAVRKAPVDSHRYSTPIYKNYKTKSEIAA
jgi:hypothetical protein